MTKLRKPPKLDYHTLIVQPEEGFDPKDWRDKPESYSILSYEGPEQFRGRADAWRFTHNREVLESGKPERWAIVCTRLESLATPCKN
jgi:hypothetical protein